MRKILIGVLSFGFVCGGFGVESFENVRPGDVVLFFGSPIGLFPETSPYTDRLMTVKKYHYLIHPLEMRLDAEPRRELSSDENRDALMAMPVHELSRYGLWTPKPEENE